MKIPARSTILAVAADECAKLGIHGLEPTMILKQDRRAAVAFLRGRVIQRLHATGRYGLIGLGLAFQMDHATIYHSLCRDLSGTPPILRDPSYATYCRINGIKPKPPRVVEPQPPLPPYLQPPLSKLMAGR